MAEEQKLKFGEARCPVCGAIITRKANDLEKLALICPQCGMESPILSPKQINGFVGSYSFGVLAPIGGVILLNYAKESDLYGMLFPFVVGLIVLGGICLIGAVLFTVLRKTMLKKARLKWQAEHTVS